MIWSAAVAAPALTFWTTLILGAMLGGLGVSRLRRPRPRTVGMIVLALALLAPIVARALVPNTFTNGTVADANQVNANFAAVSKLIVATGSYSIGATKYCGQTSTATTGSFASGSLVGYPAAKALCQSAQSCGPSQTAHMCTAEEMVRSAQMGVLPAFSPFGPPSPGWYSTGTYEQIATGTGSTALLEDCAGWQIATGSTAYYGHVWQLAPSGQGNPGVNVCSNTNPVMCCD
jgi:hypothetical protein